MRPEEVSPGTCFLYQAAYSPKEHLHIVLAVDCLGWDPDECIIANLTDALGGDQALTFDIGDHPYISKLSDVNFGDIEISTRTTVANYVNANPEFPPFDAAKLRLIGVWAKTHPAVMGHIKNILSKKYIGIKPIQPT